MHYIFPQGSIRETPSPNRRGGKEDRDFVRNQTSHDYAQQRSSARHDPGGRVVGCFNHA